MFSQTFAQFIGNIFVCKMFVIFQMPIVSRSERM